jgi:hypothetical protein
MLENKEPVQLSRLLKSTEPQQVISEVKKIFKYYYPGHLFSKILNSFKNIVNLFDGEFPGYQGCSTEYHNLGHTLETLLAAVRLADGYNLSGGNMKDGIMVDLILASLFHDTGYILEYGDNSGTGAKYTKNHIERSVNFVHNNRSILQLDAGEVAVISRMISCTGVHLHWKEIPFQSRDEEIAGAILGTADLLGQMADRFYLEKLHYLYMEFREGGIPGYETEFDIIQKTAYFYKNTIDRFSSELMNVYEYARVHFRARFGIDQNLYMEAITRQIKYLKNIIEDSSTNFRKKLKRKIGSTSLQYAAAP